MGKLPLPVQAIINQEKLSQILWVSSTPADSDAEATPLSVEAALDGKFQSRFDLVFIDASCLKQDKRVALSLIAKSRDLLSSRVLVEWQPETHPDWQEADFLGLAMRRRAVTETEGVEQIYYSYDLKTYKQVPDWLNAKFWANPHMWDKARW